MAHARTSLVQTRTLVDTFVRLATTCTLASLLLACEAAPAVQVLGDSTRLARGERSPATSPIFAGGKVSLFGARGETLGLSVRISDGQHREARLSLPEAAAKVTAFRVSSLQVSEPSTGMYGPSRGPGVYPDVLTPVAGGVDGADLAFFDVAIAENATPGRYSGELAVGQRRLPVVLRVMRAQIDPEREPLVWAFYLPREIARVHELPEDDGPELIAKERSYHDLFRAHAVLLASDLPPRRFAPRRGFMHDLRYWPVALDTSTDESIARDVGQWLELFRGTDVTPFAIPVDEPRTTADKLRAKHVAAVMGRAGAGRPRLLRGVTDVASPIYGDAIDVFISPKNFPAVRAARAHTGERFWTYNGRPPEAGSMILDTDGLALRTWGWIAFRYDIELWYAWEALYFSDRYNGGGPTAVTREPVTFDERRRGGADFGNGDGVLAYPGPLPSLRLKALRRGLLDRLLLRELATCGGEALARQIAERIVPRALGEAGARASWPNREASFEQARRQVLDGIEKHCPP